MLNLANIYSILSRPEITMTSMFDCTISAEQCVVFAEAYMERLHELTKDALSQVVITEFPKTGEAKE